MIAIARVTIAIAMLIACAGCFGPEDARPGMFLSGEVAPTPSDWSFTDDHEQIAIQVQTPYLLPHAVTIWCASADGALYVGARDPETKHWPAWADDHPDVRLRIGDRVYEVRLAPLDGAEQIAVVRRAYAKKYDLPPAGPGAGRPIRYWVVEARS
ncbi:MAG: DUF2255 family protein [Myxococcota bacterium]